MAITDELREWARNNTVQDKVLTTYPVQHPVHGTVESLLRIADHIDAEHERQLEVLYRDMSDAKYVELPVDADGVPIHVGDVMEWPNGKTFDVVGIGDGVLFYIKDADGPADWTGASTKHHHKQPTVEDMLTEFARDCLTYATCVEDHEVTDAIELYAAKLQLRGDAE